LVLFRHEHGSKVRTDSVLREGSLNFGFVFERYLVTVRIKAR
jgi:hypothetical protein